MLRMTIDEPSYPRAQTSQVVEEPRKVELFISLPVYNFLNKLTK